MKEFSQRSDAKCDDQEAKSPIAGGVLESSDRIRTKIAREGVIEKETPGRKAEKEEGNLGPLVG